MFGFFLIYKKTIFEKNEELKNFIDSLFIIVYLYFKFIEFSNKEINTLKLLKIDLEQDNIYDLA